MTEVPVIIREPTQEDISALRPIFEHWMRDRKTGAPLRNEVQAIEHSVETSISGHNVQKFLVAEEAGHVLGIMGVQPPDPDMLGLAKTEKPLELITALVSPAARKNGVGKALLAALTEKAAKENATELIVNSGPRYELSGWPFWQGQFGEPIAALHDYQGRGGSTMVWRKPLGQKRTV